MAASLVSKSANPTSSSSTCNANSSSPIPITVLISGSGSNLQAIIDAIASRSLDAQIVRVISNRVKAYGLDRSKKANIPTTCLSLPKCRSQVLAQLEVDRANSQGDTTTTDVANPTDDDRIKTLARERFDRLLAETIIKDNPSLVVCAGFMHILSAEFLKPMAEAGIKVINLHPALPGEFNGIHAIERAHDRWMKMKQAIDAQESGIVSPQQEEEHQVVDETYKRTGVMVHRVVLEVDMGEPVLTEEIPFVPGEDEDLEVFEEKLHNVEWRMLVKAVDIMLHEIKLERNETK